MTKCLFKSISFSRNPVFREIDIVIKTISPSHTPSSFDKAGFDKMKSADKYHQVSQAIESERIVGWPSSCRHRSLIIISLPQIHERKLPRKQETSLLNSAPFPTTPAFERSSISHICISKHAANPALGHPFPSSHLSSSPHGKQQFHSQEPSMLRRSTGHR